MTSDVKEITILEYNVHAFIAEVEAMARQGFVTSMVFPSYPVGEYGVVMKRANHRVIDRLGAISAGTPEQGPYTKLQMQAMGFVELKKRATREYGIGDRGLNALIRKVLKHQETIQEKNA
jgi:hypothetical protein